MLVRPWPGPLGGTTKPTAKAPAPKNSPGRSGQGCPRQQGGPRPLPAEQGAVCCGPHARSTRANSSGQCGVSRLGCARSLSRTLGLERRLLRLRLAFGTVASKCAQTSGLILLVTVTVVSLCAVFSRRLWMSAASNQQADAVPKSGVLDRDNEKDSREGREPEVLTCEGHRGAPKTNHGIRASRGA